MRADCGRETAGRYSDSRRDSYPAYYLSRRGFANPGVERFRDASLQIGFVVLLDRMVDLGCHRVVCADRRGQHFSKRDRFALQPGLGLPQLRSQESLGAVEET